MLKINLVSIVLLISACSANQKSLLSLQQEACSRELKNGSKVGAVDIYTMSGGHVGGQPSLDPTPSAPTTATIASCMSFWNEELSRENEKM